METSIWIFFWGECIILSSVLLSKPLTFFFMITDDLSYTMKFTHFWEKIGSRKGWWRIVWIRLQGYGTWLPSILGFLLIYGPGRMGCCIGSREQGYSFVSIMSLAHVKPKHTKEVSGYFWTPGMVGLWCPLNQNQRKPTPNQISYLSRLAY